MIKRNNMIGWRVTTETRDLLNDFAATEKRTMSDIIREAVSDFISKRLNEKVELSKAMEKLAELQMGTDEATKYIDLLNASTVEVKQYSEFLRRWNDLMKSNAFSREAE